MAKIITFTPPDVDRKNAKRLVKMSDDIDAILTGAVAEGLDLKEIAGIFAHRLGELLSHIEQKSELWPVCENILKKQAKID